MRFETTVEQEARERAAFYLDRGQRAASPAGRLGYAMRALSLLELIKGDSEDFVTARKMAMLAMAQITNQEFAAQKSRRFIRITKKGKK